MQLMEMQQDILINVRDLELLLTWFVIERVML
jgi:hypothetical protein